jgi:hypothetical protein
MSRERRKPSLMVGNLADAVYKVQAAQVYRIRTIIEGDRDAVDRGRGFRVEEPRSSRFCSSLYDNE